jgi:hypothetical protein
MRAAMEEIINDSYNKKAKKIKNTIYAFSTHLILLEERCKGLERTLINIQKHTNKQKTIIIRYTFGKRQRRYFLEPSKDSEYSGSTTSKR